MIVIRSFRRIEQTLLGLLQFIEQLRPLLRILTGPYAANARDGAVCGVADREGVALVGRNTQQPVVIRLAGAFDAEPVTIRVERIVHGAHAKLENAGEGTPSGGRACSKTGSFIIA